MRFAALTSVLPLLLAATSLALPNPSAGTSVAVRDGDLEDRASPSVVAGKLSRSLPIPFEVPS